MVRDTGAAHARLGVVDSSPSSSGTTITRTTGGITSSGDEMEEKQAADACILLCVFWRVRFERLLFW
jgi:hypothetical protein